MTDHLPRTTRRVWAFIGCSLSSSTSPCQPLPSPSVELLLKVLHNQREIKNDLSRVFPAGLIAYDGWTGGHLAACSLHPPNHLRLHLAPCSSVVCGKRYTEDNDDQAPLKTCLVRAVGHHFITSHILSRALPSRLRMARQADAKRLGAVVALDLCPSNTAC
jgi:hypothetical protein